MTADPLAPVTLHTGDRAARAAVMTTVLSLEALLAGGHGAALYELQQLAADPGHVLYGSTAQVLEGYSLLADGRLHDEVRAVVRAVIAGEGLDVHLVDPITGRWW